MEIEKGNTIGGQRFIEFRDDINTPCGVQLGESPKLRKHLKFSVNADFAIFTQEQIKTLLPYLQSFAETGELEPQQSPSVTSAEEHRKYLLQKYNELPQPRITPLQEDELTEAFDPENLIRVSAEQNFKLYEQEKRIKALEMLAREWMDFTSSQVPGKLNIQHADFEVWSKCRSELCERTSQLLGE